MLLPGCSASTGESSFVNGEPDSAKPILSDLVSTTVGFEALAKEIRKSIKHLHRLPPLETQADAFGCLYVLEGATLGGRVISRHIERALGLDATPWRSLLSRLRRANRRHVEGFSGRAVGVCGAAISKRSGGGVGHRRLYRAAGLVR